MVSGLSCTTAGETTDASRNVTDIVVAGGTPAGIMTAIAAARLGSRVILTEYHGHIGGMSTSGLGKSDIENKDAIAGLFKEFTQRVLKYYTEKYGADSENVALCREGYYYEPSVAEHVFNEMIAAEENIQLLVNRQLSGVEMDGDRITTAHFLNRSTGKEESLDARMFVDATYEGDLFALAGAAYRLGRESRDEFNEEHAGHIFFDYNDKVFLEGSTGAGDKKIPAYTYRLCMTDVPENSYVLTEPPPNYDRNRYLRYFDDLKEGRLSGPKVFREGHGYYREHFDTMVRIFSFARIPNGKYDVNINPRPLGFPFAGENYDYPEATWTDREKIFRHLRELTLGMIWFVQNDPEIPEAHRKLARKYHLPLDEFTDNQHFPWQLYVREARRLKGRYTLTENDLKTKPGAQRATVFDDAIITGEFPIDSFPVSKDPSPDRKVLEGYIGLLDITPYQIPYRIIVPEKVRGLLVPVAASTTHVAFSTVRMEPQWMGIGQVAGIAAHMALEHNVDPAEVPVPLLQQRLLENGQILTYFNDVKRDDKAFRAVQFWGTKGFFNAYEARTRDTLDTETLLRWLGLFRTTVGLPQQNVSSQKSGTVTIASLREMLVSLEEAMTASNTARTASAKESRVSEQTDKWLYEKRDAKASTSRGEAAHALYQLFLNTIES